MTKSQKLKDFRLEDWAIPEHELPWNAPTAATEGLQSANVIELDRYRRRKLNSPNTGK
jgi:hypothetical protein